MAKPVRELNQEQQAWIARVLAHHPMRDQDYARVDPGRCTLELRDTVWITGEVDKAQQTTYFQVD